MMILGLMYFLRDHILSNWNTIIVWRLVVVDSIEAANQSNPNIMFWVSYDEFCGYLAIQPEKYFVGNLVECSK